MSDSSGDNPYGGSRPSDQPQGQPPPWPPQQPNPYGHQQQPAYGQPPEGQPPQHDPYGRQGPAYGQPAYGQAYGGYGGPPQDSGKRPATVTAAGVVTLVSAGLSLLLFAIGLLALGIAREELVDQLRNEPAMSDIDPNDILAVAVVAFVIMIVWSIAAMVLAVFAMRRSQAARIGLVVSAAVTAVFSLVTVTSGLTVVTLVAAVAVIICLFTGGASPWYAGRHGAGGGPGHHGLAPPIA